MPTRMTPKQKLDEIRYILLTHVGNRASLEKRILEVTNK